MEAVLCSKKRTDDYLWVINEVHCEGDRSELQEIPQLNYNMEYVTTHLQEIPQRIR